MMVKCRRTVCTTEIDSVLGGGIHRNTGERYCPACARAINRACGEEVVVLPKWNHRDPPMQMIPRKPRT